MIDVAHFECKQQKHYTIQYKTLAEAAAAHHHQHSQNSNSNNNKNNNK